MSISAYASYSDSDCYPSYQCDRNVIVLFEIREGVFNPYGRLVSQTHRETGQYGSSVRFTVGAPRCAILPRYYRKVYTVFMTAVSPTGQEKTARTLFTVSSCRR